jgi:hypothetical protein
MGFSSGPGAGGGRLSPTSGRGVALLHQPAGRGLGFFLAKRSFTPYSSPRARRLWGLGLMVLGSAASSTSSTAGSARVVRLDPILALAITAVYALVAFLIRGSRPSRSST